ncbi:MAG: hypothetical protein IJP99_05090 [Methanobrevibacter sp.]|uniref:Uncharacterized protein n=1 Tax=Methanobrevibacter millerae TaxID=230361 RepID=A0A8T3VIN0_9EURY|nr:hypothetical protein [Methanobrevibacter millerae]MBE6504540.1 hypothetical protein [Methanobrevibacter millerae]MBR0058690.1 hypothetical protein [Methanobrevibacter sp.]
MKDVYYVDFDVDEVTSKINGFMSRWSVHLIHIKGQEWKLYDHSDILVYEFDFLIDFKDIEGRIKLEDLKLNVIHHIESLRDDTTYIDELVQENLLY